MKAHELLSDPTKWTKGDYARDIVGASVAAVAATAVCWCALGASPRCYLPSEHFEIGQRLYDEIRRRGILDPIPAWNDSRETTHADVLDMLRAADV